MNIDAKPTKEEKNAIASLRRVATRWPGRLRVIVVDGDGLYICKYGVSSEEFCEFVKLQVAPTNMLTDIHDDMDNGLTL